MTDQAPDSPDNVVTELVGVYHAKGTFSGEVSYWVKARLGAAHCALCDITHGAVREKGAWRECKTQLPVPFTTVHLDERDPDVARVTEGCTPCVVARTGDGSITLLVDADELAGCEGSPQCLVDLVGERARAQALVLGV